MSSPSSSSELRTPQNLIRYLLLKGRAILSTYRTFSAMNLIFRLAHCNTVCPRSLCSNFFDRQYTSKYSLPILCSKLLIKDVTSWTYSIDRSHLNRLLKDIGDDNLSVEIVCIARGTGTPGALVFGFNRS